MNKATQIIEELSEQEGWSDQTQKLILLEFLEEQVDEKKIDICDLSDYLQSRIFDDRILHEPNN